MRHTLRFRAGDDGRILLEELTIAYGLAPGSGYERDAAAVGVRAGQWVRVELLDEAGRLLDWRTYRRPMTSEETPTPASQR